MDAIEQLEMLMKGPPPPPKKKGKSDDEDSGGGDHFGAKDACATDDADADGVPNSLDEAPDDPKGEGESAADETEGADDNPFGDPAAGGEEEDLMPGEEGGDPAAGGVDPGLAGIVDQIAAAEKDFYAARGMHGGDHHKAERAMETFHKLVRKLAKQVHPNVGKDDGAAAAGGAPDENGGGNPFAQQDDSGGGDNPFAQDGGAPPRNGDDGRPPDGGKNSSKEDAPDKGDNDEEEIVKEAKKAGWSDDAVDYFRKALRKGDMLEPMADEKLDGKMTPDPANYSGDPMGGKFIDWSGTGLVGHMNEASKDGFPTGMEGDNPYSGSGAGEAHPHAPVPQPAGPAPRGVPPSAKMKPAGYPDNPKTPPPKASMDYAALGAKMRMHGKQGERGVAKGPNSRQRAVNVRAGVAKGPNSPRAIPTNVPYEKKGATREVTGTIRMGRMSGKIVGPSDAVPRQPIVGPSDAKMHAKRVMVGGQFIGRRHVPPVARRKATVHKPMNPPRAKNVHASMSGKMLESAGGLDYAYLGAKMRGGGEAPLSPPKGKMTGLDYMALGAEMHGKIGPKGSSAGPPVKKNPAPRQTGRQARQTMTQTSRQMSRTPGNAPQGTRAHGRQVLDKITPRTLTNAVGRGGARAIRNSMAGRMSDVDYATLGAKMRGGR